jgi:hypothetical protein
MSPHGSKQKSHDHTVIGYNVHGCSITLHDYMDILWSAGRSADEVHKKGHMLGDYLEECTQGCMWSPGLTFFLSPYNGEARFTISCVHKNYWAMSTLICGVVNIRVCSYRWTVSCTLVFLSISDTHDDVVCQRSRSQRPIPDNKHSQEADIYVPCDLQTHDPSKRVTANPQFRMHGRRDRQVI